jgi:hypothetical protein
MRDRRIRQFDSDMVARPIEAFCEFFGRTRDTLNQWCADGQLPGAFRHTNGEWYLDPRVYAEYTYEEAQRSWNNRADRRQVSRPEEKEWNRRLRPGEKKKG